MGTVITVDTICVPSENIVAREIDGDIIIIPLASGIGDADDELYTLNETGRAIWQRLDGQRTLKEVAASLVGEFEAPVSELETDVLGLANELAQRGILVVRD
jgi:hypothetical protein